MIIYGHSDCGSCGYEQLENCDYGIGLTCRYKNRTLDIISTSREQRNLYTCESSKNFCYNKSNYTIIAEYVCGSENKKEIELFSMNRANLTRVPLNLELYFPSLHAIELKNNIITYVWNEVLARHIELEYLDLSYNQIQNLDGNLFDGLSNLKVINFRGNIIKHIGHDIKLPMGYVELRNNICIDDYDIFDTVNLAFSVLLKCPPTISQIEDELKNRNNWLTLLESRAEEIEKTLNLTTDKENFSSSQLFDMDELCRLHSIESNDNDL